MTVTQTSETGIKTTSNRNARYHLSEILWGNIKISLLEEVI